MSEKISLDSSDTDKINSAQHEVLKEQRIIDEI